MLAATAILCVYEFLDASGPAWNRHLSGTKSLLDIAQSQIISAEEGSLSLVSRMKFSAARRAIFGILPLKTTSLDVNAIHQKTVSLPDS